MDSSDAGTDLGSDAGTVPAECKPGQSRYPRGSLVAPEDSSRWFEHIHYRQGTITFWVEPTILPTGQVELLNLGGIRVRTQADGHVWAEFDVGADAPITANIQLDPWSVGDAKLIALRWDSNNVLSGTQGGGAYRIMLHADGKRSGAKPNSFAPLALPDECLIVGDADGVFAVDQLVIYRRPLYVDDAALTGEDPFRELSLKQMGPARLPHGGLDVMFAMSHVERVGWSRGSEAEIMLVRFPIVFGEFRSIPGEERVFSGGVSVSSQEHLILDLQPGSSYAFSVLAHSSTIATASLKIFANNDGVSEDLLAQISISGGSQQNPGLMVGSFTMPETHTSVKLVFANSRANDGNVYFHALEIRKNLFASASFEASLDGVPPEEELEGWQTSPDIDVYRGPGSNGRADSHSACFSGTGVASMSQDAISAGLGDRTFYAVGAEFLNISSESQDYVGAKIYAGDNSSFLDSDGQALLHGEAMDGADWSSTGMVSYRLLDEAGRTDLLNFGNDDEAYQVDYCIDNPYLYPLESVPALVPSP